MSDRPMTRIRYSQNPQKWVDFVQQAHSEIYVACLKLRRCGQSDERIMTTIKDVLSEVPALEKEVED
jgi:hypothetical protein